MGLSVIQLIVRTERNPLGSLFSEKEPPWFHCPRLPPRLRPGLPALFGPPRLPSLSVLVLHPLCAPGGLGVPLPSGRKQPPPPPPPVLTPAFPALPARPPQVSSSGFVPSLGAARLALNRPSGDSRLPYIAALPSSLATSPVPPAPHARRPWRPLPGAINLGPALSFRVANGIGG